MGKKPFNPNIEEFTQKYAELGSWCKLASYYMVSTHTIRKFAKEIGLKSNRKYSFTQDEMDYIMKSRSEGVSLNVLADEFGCSRTVISNICKKDVANDRYYKRRYALNENKFETITKESAYFLGLIASDGCLYHHKSDNRQDILRFTLQKEDAYILEHFAKFLETCKPITYSSKMKSGKLREYASFEVSSNKIVGDIMKLGIGCQKTYNNCIPNIPLKYMPHFIRGYFDGDGSIYGNTNKINVHISGFYKNLSEIKKVLCQFNVLFEFQEDKRRKYVDDLFGGLLATNKTQIYSFLKLIYHDCGGLYLTRKYEESCKFFEMLESSELIRDKQIILYYNYAVHTKIRDMCE